MKGKSEVRSWKLDVRSEKLESGVCTNNNCNRRISYVFLFTLLTSLFTLVFSGCSREEMMFKESRVLMDTYCTITVVSSSKESAREAIDAGFDEIKKLGILLNYFSEDSELTSINRAAGIRPVKVSKETLEILLKTADIFEITDGSFDPSIAPLIKLWDFSKSKSERAIPSLIAIEEAVRLVDYRKVVTNPAASEVMLKDRGMELDLGGIAKGFGADKAVDVIRAKGIKAALVAIAGDIRGYGLSTSGNAWKVGIQNPRPDTVSDKPWEDIFASLQLEDSAISTSGDYQRFFIQDGKRYHHILSTETGFPADSNLVSVSVITPEGYLSDSLSTAVFILGADKGLALLKSKGYDGVLVTKDRKILITDNMKNKIEILNDKYNLQITN